MAQSLMLGLSKLQLYAPCPFLSPQFCNYYCISDLQPSSGPQSARARSVDIKIPLFCFSSEILSPTLSFLHGKKIQASSYVCALKNKSRTPYVPSLFLQLHLIPSHFRCHNTKNMDCVLLMFALPELCGLITHASLSNSKTRSIEFYAHARRKIW